jgi:hypothetical protein
MNTPGSLDFLVHLVTALELFMVYEKSVWVPYAAGRPKLACVFLNRGILIPLCIWQQEVFWQTNFFLVDSPV